MKAGRLEDELVADALGMPKCAGPPHEVLGLTRRQFLKLSALVAGTTLVDFTLGSCESVIKLLERIKNRPVRRDIATLSANDPVIASYETAISVMQGLPMTDRRNWTRQAQIHQDSCRHRSWLFFPWHRAYVFFFEQICRELSGDPSFALPYWNWTANPQIPPIFLDQSSLLFHANRVAGPTSSANSGAVGQTVIDGFLGNPNFLTLAGGVVPKNDTAQFGPSYGTIEQTPHNSIHNFVGGTMLTFMSPLDPLFWTHHNRVDELWVEWNMIKGNPNTNNTDWTETEFTEFCDRNGNPVQVSVAEMLLYPLFSYRFDTQV